MTGSASPSAVCAAAMSVVRRVGMAVRRLGMGGSWQEAARKIAGRETGSPQLDWSPMESSRELAVTFAGGGNRAFYQVGFVERWWSDLAPRIRAVSACSAGASTAIT